jgi:hypothetical protein
MPALHKSSYIRVTAITAEAAQAGVPTFDMHVDGAYAKKMMISMMPKVEQDLSSQPCRHHRQRSRTHMVFQFSRLVQKMQSEQ